MSGDTLTYIVVGIVFIVSIFVLYKLVVKGMEDDE